MMKYLKSPTVVLMRTNMGGGSVRVTALAISPAPLPPAPPTPSATLTPHAPGCGELTPTALSFCFICNEP